jgi:hypothetical protein
MIAWQMLEQEEQYIFLVKANKRLPRRIRDSRFFFRWYRIVENQFKKNNILIAQYNCEARIGHSPMSIVVPSVDRTSVTELKVCAFCNKYLSVEYKPTDRPGVAMENMEITG